jgi:hypothetical protein
MDKKRGEGPKTRRNGVETRRKKKKKKQRDHRQENQ